MPQELPFIESLNIQTTIKWPYNKILINAAGQEQRIVPHQSPLREFNLSKNVMTPADTAAVFSLFNNKEGRRHPFLYKDKSDYEATRLAKNLGAGTYTQGLVINTGTKHLLVKKYACGSNIHYRPIHYVDTLTIYDQNGAEVTGWTFNDGGVITGLGGTWYTADFTFTIPVRFTEDSINAIMEAKKINKAYSLNMTLVEQRFNIPEPVTDTFNEDINHLFAIDFLFKSTTSYLYNNQVKDLASGFNVIKQYQQQPITEITFGERSGISQVDLEYLQAFWLCVKGCGALWSFEDVNENQAYGSFRDNDLSYTLIAPEPIYYSVAPLTARLFYESVSLDFGYYGWGGTVLTLCDCVRFG